MKKPVRIILGLALGVGLAAAMSGCGQRELTTTVLTVAPPGPTDLGPAFGLSTPPADAIVFDLRYRPQTGNADDIPYNSFYGYGGSPEAAKSNPFLQEVRKKASGLYYVQNPSFKGREWAAVEYHRRQVSALYFDLDADGKLAENERILPTRKTGQGFQFITPDFVHRLEGGGQTLCRALLQVSFYGNDQPNCMWSPAALMEGEAKLNGKPIRLMLFSSNPGGPFDRYGSSRYALLPPERVTPGTYIPREALSTLIHNEGQFYRLKIEGRRSNGLPARVLLAKDTSPTGDLVVKVIGSNSLQARVSSLYFYGADDDRVAFRCSPAKDKVSVPAGAYVVDSGFVGYGSSNAQDWEVSFSGGPRTTVKAGELTELAVGGPALTVRAVDEKDRYDRQTPASTTFKRGGRIYLEPRIMGKNREVFGRFRQNQTGGGNAVDRPPKITITGPDGKQLLATTMEYG